MIARLAIAVVLCAGLSGCLGVLYAAEGIAAGMTIAKDGLGLCVDFKRCVVPAVLPAAQREQGP